MQGKDKRRAGNEVAPPPARLERVQVPGPDKLERATRVTGPLAMRKVTGPLERAGRIAADRAYVRSVPTLAIADAWLETYANPRTQLAHRRHLDEYIRFAHHGAWPSFDPMSATPAEVDAYAGYLEARDLAPATRATRLSTLRLFYAFAVDQGAVAENPVKRGRS